MLTIDGHEHRLQVGDAPLRFDGGAAAACCLAGGPTRDFNLMLKGGRGAMRSVSQRAPWDEEFAMRGLFSAVAGTWSGDRATRALKEHTLLWDDSAGPGDWTFSPDGHRTGPAGWWLGFTP